MRSKGITILAGVIAAVVLVSLTIGLASPDGSVGEGQRATPSAVLAPATASPSPTPTATTPTPAGPTADRAPESVQGIWPGRSDAVAVDGKTVDWCPAVRTSGAAEAVAVFGKAAVREAACTAVRFVFEQRYSRLSLPRTSYAAKDLDFVLTALAPVTVSTYHPRVAHFVACPNCQSARDALGLVLFRGAGTTAGASHASAGRGRVFYGKAYGTAGYRGRAVWVNPTFSKVAIRVDRSKAMPRIIATLEASAAVPVFNSSARRDDMLTVPTRAVFILRREGKAWKLGGWDIHSGAFAYAALAIV
ncbi:hypothetical protein [Aeromicrobium sp. A1-2]|uniref:hypothetical protein n=1 Tax=Aeromicrobium sp. A1-2 TaxID=2107713 RepID=UPI0013C3322D|nr:hypothetical protein [Aeromicrobium sp. A1-2]